MTNNTEIPWHCGSREISILPEMTSGSDLEGVFEVHFRVGLGSDGEVEASLFFEIDGRMTPADEIVPKHVLPSLVSHGLHTTFSDDFIDMVGMGLCFLKVYSADDRMGVLEDLGYSPSYCDFIFRAISDLRTGRIVPFQVYEVGNNHPGILHVDTNVVLRRCMLPEEFAGSINKIFSYRCESCRIGFYQDSFQLIECSCGRDMSVRPYGYPRGVVAGKFRDLFSGSSKQVSRVAPKVGFSLETDRRISDSVNKNAERETFQYERPKQELGITDLLKQHDSGDRFLYAAVTSGEEEEESGLLSRLRQAQPRLNRKPIDPGHLPILELYKDVETFPLSAILPPVSSSTNKGKGKMKAKMTYIRIADVIAIFGSLVSYDNSFTKAKICIVDNRLLGNKVSKTAVIGTNIISKTNLSLSYCFPRNEAADINLTVARESAFLEEGRQWGTIQLMIQLEETEFPTQFSNRAVRARNNIPKGMLEERHLDPDYIDITVLNSDREVLREKYLEGDVADEVEPVRNKMEVTRYAKSSLSGPRGKKPNKVVSPEWNFINDVRQAGTNAGDNSVEPSESEPVTFYPSPQLKPKDFSTSPPQTSQTEISLKSAMKQQRRVTVRDPTDEDFSLP